jgi:hypothetical protein
MRLLWTFGTALLLTALTVSSQSLASEAEPGSLRALAARQDLCDMVCFARADGSISRIERMIILTDAKEVLSHEEYLNFKKALDRIAPPKKPSPSALAKTTRNEPASPAPQQTSLPAEPAGGPVIPTGAALPDRVAPSVFFR